MVRTMRCHSSTFECMTCCFNFFFLCVLFELLPTLLSPSSYPSVFFVSFITFFLIRVRFYHYVSHTLHSHTSLSHSSCTLIVNSLVAKDRFLVQPAAVNSFIVCEAKMGGNPKRKRLSYITRFILSCSRSHTTTTASLTISMGNLGTHSHCAQSTIGTLV